MTHNKLRPEKPAVPSPELSRDVAAHSGMRAGEDDLAPSRSPMVPSSKSGASSAQHLDLGGLSKHWRPPQDEFEEARLDYILTDLDECLTFASIVEAEYRTDKRDHAERTLAALEECYSDMLRFYHQAGNLEPGTRADFESKFKQVRERLDRIRQ